MSKQIFSSREAITFGWKKMKKHFWLYAQVMILMLLISLLPKLLSIFLYKYYFWLFVLFVIEIWILALLIKIGLIRLNLKIVRGEEAEFKEVFLSANRLVKYFLGKVLYLLVILAGLIPLIIFAVVWPPVYNGIVSFLTNIGLPGIFIGIIYSLVAVSGGLLAVMPIIYWGLKYYFIEFYIADKGLEPVAAFRQSARATENVKWQLLLFTILMQLINLAGFIALGVGLFFTVPATMLAMAFVYQKLDQNNHA
ncbi:MAG: hypothetical protein Q8L21_01900 [Candidatus Komeilibacteria bacterium]|nr:hypothetical protein [Candidatus Komeilibacteria bacterium]